MLGGAEYLGQIQLPLGSENRIFLRPDGNVVMVIWNRNPTREKIFLGRDVQHIDLDGRSSTPAQEDEDQILDVGPQPAFVFGLDEAIARWRMAVAFEKNHVPSVFNKPHRNSLKLQNFFPQGVGGSLTIVVPQASDRWVIEPARRTFSLASGEQTSFPFDIRLKNAYYGAQPIRVDFDIVADESFRFSAYKEMEVGTEDLTLDVKTHLDKDGTLIVEQFMTNKLERLADFRCYLLPQAGIQANPAHRRQRMHVYRLGAKVDRKVYRIPEGRSLIGREMVLDIEEVNGGSRRLKYRFEATQEAPADPQAIERENDEPVDEKSDHADESSRVAGR
jgi:hypothetical protein